VRIPDAQVAPRWKRILLSGWVSYFGLMGGAVALEYFTRPWRNPVIPTPYTMFYLLGTVVCALHGYWWGLAASLSWLAVATLMGHFYWHFEVEPTLRDYLIRFAGHIIVPIWISRPGEQRRKILAVISTAVSHEFNNLLMVIIGNSCLIRDSLSADDQQRLDEILKAGDRAAKVVENMRRYANLGRISPDMVNISEMLSNIEPANGADGNGKVLNI